MNAIKIIDFLGKPIEEKVFLEFCDKKNINYKKIPKKERAFKNVSAKYMSYISKPHGIEFWFRYNKSCVILDQIFFFKPISDVFNVVPYIEFPFGLYFKRD